MVAVTVAAVLEEFAVAVALVPVVVLVVVMVVVVATVEMLVQVMLVVAAAPGSRSGPLTTRVWTLRSQVWEQ